MKLLSEKACEIVGLQPATMRPWQFVCTTSKGKLVREEIENDTNAAIVHGLQM